VERRQSAYRHSNRLVEGPGQQRVRRYLLDADRASGTFHHEGRLAPAGGERTHEVTSVGAG
jgi:hypothetical protein